jgi:4-amino-4-deoxy-L-arabinose transferase-like glycosyltransferase
MNININPMMLAFFLPLAFGILLLIWPKALRVAREPLAVLGAALNFALAFFLYGKQGTISLPWAGFGMDFSRPLSPSR